MKLSQRGLYAIQALLHLAGSWDKGLVKSREIAEAEEIPEKFLEAILASLRTARFVTSVRGRDGGYRLRRPPGEIVIGEVVRAIDGPLAPLGDVAELAERIRTDPRHAGLFELLLDVRNAAARILDRTSLADLLASDLRLARERKSIPSE